MATNVRTTITATDWTLDRMTRQAPARYVGACKRCGTQCRVEGRRGEAHIAGRLPYQVVVSVEGVMFGCADMGTNTLACRAECADCGYPVKCTLVYKGKKASKHKCGGICRSAKGPSCDCLCGGEFHGAGG